MTGDIIPLHGDPHHEALTLLPWYVTGKLDAQDLARVEAHLRTCLACQAELTAEQSLQAELADIATDPVTAADTDRDWAALSRRMAVRPRRPRVASWLATAANQWNGSAPWLRWAVAAQFGLLVLFGAFALPRLIPAQAPANYHTLGAAPAVATANVIVMFRPDTTEQTLRQTLKTYDARLVDGPTAANAYMLRVPADQRTAVIAKLRGQSSITLAQPVDAGWTP